MQRSQIYTEIDPKSFWKKLTLARKATSAIALFALLSASLAASVLMAGAILICTLAMALFSKLSSTKPAIQRCSTS